MYYKTDGWTEQLKVGDEVLVLSGGKWVNSVTYKAKVAHLTKTQVQLEGFPGTFRRGRGRSEWAPYRNEGTGRESYNKDALYPATPENLALLEEYTQQKAKAFAVLTAIGVVMVGGMALLWEREHMVLGFVWGLLVFCVAFAGLVGWSVRDDPSPVSGTVRCDVTSGEHP